VIVLLERNRHSLRFQGEFEARSLNLPRIWEDPLMAARRQEASMNHSIYSADRMTHLKIVVVALVAGIAVAGFGISARINSDPGVQTARVIKAGAPVAVSSSNTMVVR